ncbi:MAG: pyridine nucleotide-disulfide oxidoreductase [Acidiferrobacteraceae bacterium]|jgi:sulfide:quinone oxidoreductase|nr:pyridine nucleotide-disulfide oxidoreductase [Acidiferrobacteraceae bacterium]MDP6434073.1 FAD/NAD(P)-binding oxidoreductase [Arenicellales bacterium]MDP6672682.1 FAD/NAD(P)-binding oxidoreductase [Arenicellales bacterium]MDP6724303.1 FAD/NAD(P)-binding oxidoreductase [Arenicellales bacterium]|tara:strand:- start:5563 stop:6834 length:1272 start_codon:yes stop_codon:yes gene_type:complete
MAHTVIIGAGTGGLPAAYDIKKSMGRGHEVTVISNTPLFNFVPSNPWVAVGWRDRQDVTFELEKYLARKNIRFIDSGVSRINPDDNSLIVGGGEEVRYDYLVIATGPELAFDEVEGLGPEHHTHSVCTLPHAEEAYRGWQKFVKNPGPIIVGAVQGASCFGPAYEFAMIMDTDLRRQKIRNQVPITFVTSEPYIGHLGLSGVGDSRGMLESEMRNRHITFYTNSRVKRVEPEKMVIEQLDHKGEAMDEEELGFSYSMMIPAFRGIECVSAVGEELVNPRGFVKVDEFQRNPAWKNIYSLGVCIAIPPVEATPVPTGTPKTGYMIESMVTAVAHNIVHDLNDEEPEAVASWNAFCLADMGDTGVAFIAVPQIPPRNLTWFKRGRWVHWAKVIFEKYFIRNMKRGSTEPLYQRLACRLMGLNRLR